LRRGKILPKEEALARASLFPMVAAAIMLTGCASVVKGSSQSINIATPPTAGANCTLSSKEGSWTLTSPGSVTVDKSKEDIQVRCIKPGWQDASAIIPSNFQGWTLGNILLGGVIGLGVDAATGALHEYPSAFQVPMLPDGTPLPAARPPADLPSPNATAAPGA
jgi:hypothetical protein